MKLGDEVFVHGYVDEIRKDIIIIRNKGGFFGTDPCEVWKRDPWLWSREDLTENYDVGTNDMATMELKREFLRMASYIDVILDCSDDQKETLLGFVSRLSEFMPWNERD